LTSTRARRYGGGIMQQPFTPWRWSRVTYERLVECGAFDGDPVELIGGQLIVAEPQGAYHATVVGLVDDALRALLPRGWMVRSQLPISLDDESTPEPDVVAVRGTRLDYLTAHPTVPALVIEVADTSLIFDRRSKGSLYARGGVQDYWIVNIAERAVEVYRDPLPDPAAVWGWRYQSLLIARPGDTVTPLALPSTPVAVQSLLPPPAV
jgi:Uma2 family endonuclease